MVDWHPWAAVAVALIMEIGRCMRDWLKFRYHVSETPGLMANVKLETTCTVAKERLAEKLEEKILDNSASIGALKVQVEDISGPAKPANSGTR